MQIYTSLIKNKIMYINDGNNQFDNNNNNNKEIATQLYLNYIFLL